LFREIKRASDETGKSLRIASQADIDDLAAGGQIDFPLLVAFADYRQDVRRNLRTVQGFKLRYS
jgi:hypothetical protein